jgi:hypothetical protein
MVSTTKQDEQKKQNALFNLDFEEYKKQVKQNYIEEQVDFERIKYLDNYCKPTVDNTFLIIGIIMISFAFILIFMYKD